MLKQLVLLVSGTSNNPKVLANQIQARELLRAQGADFTEIDAADPENHEYCVYLEGQSGLKGVYPQLFLIEETMETSFLGDWEEVDAINDASSLPKDVLEAHPTLLTWDRLQLCEPDHILVLESSVAMHRETKLRQERATMLLQARRLPHLILDGADPATKDQRNTLFEISGIRAVYPQFFINRTQHSTYFLGNWHDMEAISDASRLPQNVLEANPSIITWEKVFGY